MRKNNGYIFFFFFFVFPVAEMKKEKKKEKKEEKNEKIKMQELIGLLPKTVSRYNGKLYRDMAFGCAVGWKFYCNMG